jgi:hypothetical protein
MAGPVADVADLDAVFIVPNKLRVTLKELNLGAGAFAAVNIGAGAGVGARATCIPGFGAGIHLFGGNGALA